MPSPISVTVTDAQSAILQRAISEQILKGPTVESAVQDLLDREALRLHAEQTRQDLTNIIERLQRPPAPSSTVLTSIRALLP